jgi:hypothetical protein
MLDLGDGAFRASLDEAARSPIEEAGNRLPRIRQDLCAGVPSAVRVKINDT